MKKESFKQGITDGIPIALGVSGCFLYVWYDGGAGRTVYLAGGLDFF